MINDTIVLTLNGALMQTTCRPDTTVLTWLRAHQRLTGTKEGCAEGDCGACTVLVSTLDGRGYMAANSCIMAIGQVAGRHVLTVEGLSADLFHPIQSAMAANGSSQCGFCTPGIVVSLAGLLNKAATPSEADIHDALAGNLCRCTGYKPIVEAAMKTANYALPASALPIAISLSISSNGAQFHRPKTLPQLFKLRAKFPTATLLGGGTDLGVALAEHEATWPVAIWTGAVQQLLLIKQTKSHWHFGAAVTWSQMLETLGSDLPSFTTLLRRFGSTQIRNMGTIGGNIGTASPIGDGPPPLIALGASITLASPSGERTMPLEDFFLDYRKTALASDEVIKSIAIPKPANDQHFRVWKISKRYDQDISTVCGAFNLTIKDGVITSARVAFGGMAATPRRTIEVEAALIGTTVAGGDFSNVASAIRTAFKPLSDWRGTSDYRSQVAGNLALRLGADLNGQTVEVMG
jgi:xanthine dehydrogenase small subunit